VEIETTALSFKSTSITPVALWGMFTFHMSAYFLLLLMPELAFVTFSTFTLYLEATEGHHPNHFRLFMMVLQFHVSFQVLFSVCYMITLLTVMLALMFLFRVFVLYVFFPKLLHCW
jgi:hypothetical protein